MKASISFIVLVTALAAGTNMQAVAVTPQTITAHQVEAENQLEIITSGPVYEWTSDSLKIQALAAKELAQLAKVIDPAKYVVQVDNHIAPPEALQKGQRYVVAVGIAPKASFETPRTWVLYSKPAMNRAEAQRLTINGIRELARVDHSDLGKPQAD